MWDKLYLNARIATFSNNSVDEIIEDGALAVKNGKIIFVGPASSLESVPEQLAHNVLNLNGQLVTPGLVDCHSHLVFGGDRAAEFKKRLEGASYAEIAQAGGGIKSTLKATIEASEDELFETALKTARKMVRGGVTTLEIKSGYGGDLATELKMLRVAKRVGEALGITVQKTWLAAHVLPVEYANDRTGYLERLVSEDLPKVISGDYADAVDAFCEHIAFTADELRPLFQAAKDCELKLKLHAEQLSQAGGTQMAADYGALSVDHIEYADENDVIAMKNAGMTGVLLPGAFYYLNETQKPPVDLLRKHGVPMALATDYNPGSSPITSLTLVANMGCVMFGMTPDESLLAITKHGAKALGLQDNKGSLELGKDADFCAWDIRTPSEIAYWIGGTIPNAVYHQGKKLEL